MPSRLRPPEGLGSRAAVGRRALSAPRRLGRCLDAYYLLAYYVFRAFDAYYLDAYYDRLLRLQGAARALARAPRRGPYCRAARECVVCVRQVVTYAGERVPLPSSVDRAESPLCVHTCLESHPAHLGGLSLIPTLVPFEVHGSINVLR